jgi:hypothetical protein
LYFGGKCGGADCKEELKPKIGQIFDTPKEVEDFYKNYAHSVGFSVRCSSESKNKEGMKRWKYFVCSKEGYKPVKKMMQMKVNQRLRQEEGVLQEKDVMQKLLSN